MDALIAKKTIASLKSFKKLCRKTFACEVDAQTALQQWIEEQEFIYLSNSKVVQQIKHAKRGRPGLDNQQTVTFQITGYLASSLALREEAAQTTGHFILATNDLSGDVSMQFILDEYKSQQAVDRGFRFLKSPDFLTSSLFLKKPERIEALLMIMTCSLMVYAGIEHLIRKKLAEHSAYFPDMKKKPTQRPTARWVFFCFQGISVLIINQDKTITSNIIERQRNLLNVLGKAYWKFYS